MSGYRMRLTILQYVRFLFEHRNQITWIEFDLGFLTISCRFQPWCLYCSFPRSDGRMISPCHRSHHCQRIKADFDSSTTSDSSAPATKKCSDLHGRPSPAGKCARNRQRRRKKKRRRRSGTWSSSARRSPDLWIPSVSSGSSTALTGQSSVSSHHFSVL